MSEEKNQKNTTNTQANEKVETILETGNTRETKERVDYEIYDKYTCDPTDLSCLDQNQDGKKEVTLITCNPGGLTRLICKAREV